MPNQYTAQQAIEFGMLVTLVGREAGGEPFETMHAVAWSVRSRVESPRWWGHTWLSVMALHEQYSSISPPAKDNDPNLRVWPEDGSRKWDLAIEAAESAYWGAGDDPVRGATHYYDSSLDADPPSWAKDGSTEHVCDVGRLRFFKAS